MREEDERTKRPSHQFLEMLLRLVNVLSLRVLQRIVAFEKGTCLQDGR